MARTCAEVTKAVKKKEKKTNHPSSLAPLREARSGSLARVKTLIENQANKIGEKKKRKLFWLLVRATVAAALFK